MLYEFCKKCGRRLKSNESKKLGYGPSCFNRLKMLPKSFTFVLGEEINESDNRQLSNNISC